MELSQHGFDFFALTLAHLPCLSVVQYWTILDAGTGVKFEYVGLGG